MSSIYFHIPFCKQACHYCDFHFSTRLEQKKEVLEVMCRELVERKDYLHDKTITSVYFGGGTPSLLNASEINQLLELVQKYFSLSSGAEITLEANPDDLGVSKIKELKSTPINRFSIGVQSFYQEDLNYMHRSHTSAQAETAVKRAQDAGFTNLTIDLIYGFPLLSNEKWKSNIQRAINLQVQHLSCYSMTVEPGTALDKLVNKGRRTAMNEEQSASQFELVMDLLTDTAYRHYEISNFGKEGFLSRHNTDYWRGVHYLGIGPSAHSYDGESRQWNVRNNLLYVQSNAKNFEKELLTKENKVNEAILTGLRTDWGIKFEELKTKTEINSEITEIILSKAENKIREGLLERKENTLLLTRKGKLFADRIASELFI